MRDTPPQTFCGLGRVPLRLYSPHENSLNPCFVAFVSGVLQFALALFAAYQILILVYHNYYGPHRIKFAFGSPVRPLSVGVCHCFKIVAVVAQLLLLMVLSAVTFSAHDLRLVLLVTIIVSLVATILPLHLVEPTRSLVPLASLLIFWLVQAACGVLWVAQDLLTPHKLFLDVGSSAASNSLRLTMEVMLCANATLILVLETNFYAPTRELVDYYDLNDWHRGNLRNFFSELTILWALPYISEVYHDDKFSSELPQLPLEMQCSSAYPKFRKTWDLQTNPLLFWTLVRANSANLSILYVFFLTELVLSFTQPFLLRRLLVFFALVTSADNAEAPPYIVGITIVFAILIVSIGRFVLTNRAFIYDFKVIFAFQAALSSMIYEKALRLLPQAKKSKSTGDIINHLSTDVAELQELTELLPDAINNPLRLVICLYSLHSLIGNATWGGLLAAAVLVPLSTKVSTSIFLLYNQGVAYKDARVRLTSEIFNSIKSIKLYSWEKPMLERLDEVRNGQELTTNKRIGVFNAFATFLWSCIPFCISCASFAMYVYLTDVPLTPEIIFPALSLFDMLAEPILVLPHNFSSYVEIKVSLARLSTFFKAEELKSTAVHRSFNPLPINGVSVEVEGLSFVWSDGSDDIALHDISLKARKGQLTCLVGKVGSGKTTLIKSLLGQIPISPKSHGGIRLNGSIAYCLQAPWIMNATVKENILFGCRYNADFYEKTVDACELLSDFKALPDGDRTVVGEKGISLSGGQKARISLARAVYARADIYVLDDVLSAVDAHVGKNITKKVLSHNGLLSTKTIILATNSVNVLREANEIVLLKDGRIIERGTYNEVMLCGADLADLISEFGQKGDHVETYEESDSSDTHSILSEVQAYQPSVPLEHHISRRESVTAASLVSFGDRYDEIDEQVDEDSRAPRMGHTVEEGEKGKVKLDVYLEYFKACNYTYIFFYLLMTSSTIATAVLGKYLLKHWSELNEHAGHNTNPTKYLGTYALLGVIGGMLTLAAAFVVWTYCIIRGSTYFHDKMAANVLRSPMLFFDTTPIGRILNRFSEDMGMIDEHLPWVIIDLLEMVLNGVATFVVIVINIPPMAVIILVLMVVFNFIRKFFIPASRELKRLRSIQKSPVFSHLQELVNGVETLRAYDQQDRFVHKNTMYLDARITTDYMLTMCNRWLGMRLQTISALLLLTSGLFVIATIDTEIQLSAAMVGLVMTYALSITSLLTGIVRRWAEVESRSVSIERLVEYCNLPSEAPMYNDATKPKETWPASGAIDFVNYSTKYRANLDPVLKNITLDIKPCEKIGIVGRTGAGKSSLTLALFRIIEATAGHIEIDSINTSTLGLFDLRHKLSIIPQDLHTIEGTVRQNLDPFGEFSDARLWEILALAHLRDHVAGMTTKDEEASGHERIGLDAQVYEGGSNLSLGQKQLLCLARALLNPSKVLVLDEATAAVDVQTDKIVQETIRSAFKDRTILTIAHRLDTIMDSDRVVVLDHGEVREFDTVPNLLALPQGIFRLLCEEGGYIHLK